MYQDIVLQCRVVAHRYICRMQQSSAVYDETASLRDGLYTMTDMNISSAVTDRLTGYAVMIAWKVLCDGNIAKIQNYPHAADAYDRKDSWHQRLSETSQIA